MKKKSPKIIFFGTPEFAAVILKFLIEKKYNIVAVFSQPDKKTGRWQEVAFSQVKKIAIKNKIKVFQPNSPGEENVIREIKKIKPDLIVVAAYGKILPKKLLEIPKFGAVNVHASLLPKCRGASPIQCAILAGEKETGITLIKMNEKMDEGDILAQEKTKIGENETAETLLEKLSKLGANMIVKFIPDWVGGKIKAIPQDQKCATYCKPIRREDGKIDWNLNAEDIYRRWRAYQPWPGIYALYKVKNQLKRLKLLKIEVIPDAESGEKPGKIIEYNQNIAVQSKKGLVALKIVQLEGKREMEIEKFVRGHLEFVGSNLK